LSKEVNLVMIVTEFVWMFTKWVVRIHETIIQLMPHHVQLAETLRMWILRMLMVLSSRSWIFFQNSCVCLHRIWSNLCTCMSVIGNLTWFVYAHHCIVSRVLHNDSLILFK
jgi:hypothetical protein